MEFCIRNSAEEKQFQKYCTDYCGITKIHFRVRPKSNYFMWHDRFRIPLWICIRLPPGPGSAIESSGYDMTADLNIPLFRPFLFTARCVYKKYSKGAWTRFRIRFKTSGRIRIRERIMRIRNTRYDLTNNFYCTFSKFRIRRAKPTGTVHWRTEINNSRYNGSGVELR